MPFPHSTQNHARKKVIHVPRRFVQEIWGGTETVIHQVCHAQLTQGLLPEIHTSLALCNRREERWHSIPIRRYPYVYPFFGLTDTDRSRLDMKGGNLFSTRMFFALAMMKDTKIYHAHAIGRIGGIVLTAARLQKRPFVITLHGNVFDIPRAEYENLTEVSNRRFEWGKPLGLLVRSRRVLDDADAVICVGYSEFEAARRHLSHDRIYYIPNGVNPGAYQATPEQIRSIREEFGISGNAFVAGCISRIDPQKDQATLLKAFARFVEERNTQTQTALILAGPVTSENYAIELRSLATQLGIGDKVHFVPPVEPESDRHAALLGALDAFVLPSRHEPFGIVVLEAWAAGKPVIASHVGGLQRLVSDGENGIHFATGDSEALVQALKQMEAEPALRARLARAGQESVRVEYAWNRLAGELDRVYAAAEQRVHSKRRFAPSAAS